MKMEIFDIYPFYYIPFWQTTFFKISIGVVLFLILASVVLYFYLKNKRKKITAWQWAILELEKLSKSIDSFETKKDFKFFYFDLTSIIKKYLKKRFDWNTTDKTDEELIIFLKDKNFDDELLVGLKKMLNGAIWIKFANESVLKTESKKDLGLALRMVEKTIPKDS